MTTFEELLDEQVQHHRVFGGFHLPSLSAVDDLEESLETLVADGVICRKTVTTTETVGDLVTETSETSYLFTEEAEHRVTDWRINQLDPLAQEVLTHLRRPTNSSSYYHVGGPVSVYRRIGATLTEVRQAYRDLQETGFVYRHGSEYQLGEYGKRAQKALATA